MHGHGSGGESQHSDNMTYIMLTSLARVILKLYELRLGVPVDCDAHRM
jgi:hypothetical protein